MSSSCSPHDRRKLLRKKGRKPQQTRRIFLEPLELRLMLSSVPLYNFSDATYLASEGNVTNTVNDEVFIYRGGLTTGTSSLDVVLTGGATNPATSGIDFTSGPITVTFGPGEISKSPARAIPSLSPNCPKAS